LEDKVEEIYRGHWGKKQLARLGGVIRGDEVVGSAGRALNCLKTWTITRLQQCKLSNLPTP
jgi:hypothetical protein